MKETLERLFQQETLTSEEAKHILVEIAEGKHNETQISAFMTAYIMRTPTIEELLGFRQALLELCIPISFGGKETIDLCGTGGDHKNTFNISTLTSFVVAGTGIPVTKHGNYGVSSISGSSNVLEALGVQFTKDQSILQQQLEDANICFLHAPLFHPALKEVGPIRKKLGIKTFFNLLGPLVNPSKPTHQMTGVYNKEISRLYKYILEKTNTKYSIIYSHDGYDEISLTSSFSVKGNHTEEVQSAEYLGLNPIRQDQIYGGNSIEEAADLFRKIIQGKGTEEQENVVIANASFAIQTFHPGMNIMECKEMAMESLKSNKAEKALKTLIN